MKLSKVDSSIFPLIKITINPLEPTVALLDESFRDIESAIRASNYSILIFNLTMVKHIPSDLRVKQGSWFKHNEDLIKEKVQGIIIINSSPIINFMIKSVMLIKKPPVPYAIVVNMVEAMKWADSNLVVEV